MSAVGALGAFLTTLGRGKDDRRKEALAERLQKEAEERREQYDKNKEDRTYQRDLKKVAGPPKFIKGENGAVEKVYYNSEGSVIKREAAAPSEVEEYQMGVNKDKLGLSSLEADIGYKGALTDEARARAADAPLDRALKRENLESMITSRRETTDIRRQEAEDRQAARDGKDKPKDTSLPGLTNYLIDQFGDLKEQYTKGDNATMTPDEFRQVAMASIKIAAQKGQDARIIFQDALRRFGKPRVQGK